MRYFNQLNELVTKKENLPIRLANTNLVQSISKELGILAQLAKGITRADLQPLPESTLKNIEMMYISLFDLMREIDSRDIPEPEANAMIQGFEAATYTELFEQLTSIKSSMTHLLNFSPTQLIESQRKLAQDSLSEMDVMKARFEEIIKKAEAQNQDLGIKKYATVFSTEAARFGRASSTWLVFAIATFLTIVILCIWLLSKETSNTIEPILLIQNSVVKLLLTSALFYALSVCVKNYRVNKHNQTLNKHRQTALETFEAFSNSPTADAQTKNAVLLATTQAIFTQQHTGFNALEKDSEMSNKIIEIIRPIKAE